MNNMNKLILLYTSCLFLTLHAYAQNNDEEFASVPAPPEIPDPLQSGQPIEPEVTIIRGEKSITEEYRLNGKLYMIKVIPEIGKPYYLIDRDGDGIMEKRMSSIYDDDVVPQWVLFSW